MYEIDSEMLFEGQFLNFFKNTCKQGNKEVQWEYVSHPNNERSVIIVPYHVEKRAYVLTKEFRIPIKDYEIGFPSGTIEEGEEIENTIQRELKEETGLNLEKIERISPFVYTSSGLSDEANTIAFVNVSGEPSNKNLQPYEDITAFFVNIDEMSKLLISQDLKWGSTAWLVCNFMVTIKSMIQRYEMTINNLNLVK
jgi:ADP-ribose pyrophosphatase